MHKPRGPSPFKSRLTIGPSDSYRTNTALRYAESGERRIVESAAKHNWNYAKGNA